MLLSARECAETMNQLCRLKVKVTLQGHGIMWWCFSCPSDCSLVSFDRGASYFAQCLENRLFGFKRLYDVTLRCVDDKYLFV